MEAIINHGFFGVKDPEGGIWYPDEEAQKEIQESTNPETTVLCLVEEDPMRGRWHC